MKNIIKIYRRDIKNIFTNWVAMVIISGLIVLPSLYAWFNIKSSWDPYGNTSNIAVAIVNKDKGTHFNEKTIDIGKELVTNLKQNKKIGWRFVDEKQAAHGVKYGTYYASITIPEDFSKKILSITTDKLEKPSLIYSVNEKKNAVAPKITEKGATSIEEEITKNFVETANGMLFKKFNELGILLEKNKPKLQEISNTILYIDQKIPEINKSVDDYYKEAVKIGFLVENANKNMPLIEDTLNSGIKMVDNGIDFMNKVKEGGENLAPYIKQDLVMANNTLNSVKDLIPGSIEGIKNNSPRVKSILTDVVSKLNSVKGKVDSSNKVINSLGNISKFNMIKNLSNNLSDISGRLEIRIDTLNAAVSAIDRGEKPSINILYNVGEEINNINNKLSYITTNFDSEITPNISKVMSDSVGLSENTLKLLENANKDLPLLKEVLKKANTSVETGEKELSNIKWKLPGIESDIHKVAERLRKLNDNEKINEIVKMLKSDAVKKSEFLSNPVKLEINRVFPIPNYGSAMTPFFTTLSLWVGALILVSLLSVNIHPLEGVDNVTMNEATVGRYLTFMTIAMCQALVVSLGDIFLLKSYVVSPAIFVIYSMFISIVFSMIVYSLVSIFGNVGKALAVILLVLQISASGGTFPIEVTPPFFQSINPLLPFTYAIGGMRECVGGIIRETLIHNTGILCAYFIIAIALVLILKKKLHNINEGLVEKFKTSGLAEE